MNPEEREIFIVAIVLGAGVAAHIAEAYINWLWPEDDSEGKRDR